MLTNITSLTGNGLKDWLFQRVSAIILAVYTLFVLGFMACHTPMTFEVWHRLFQCNAMRVFSSVTLLSLIIHSWIGIWTISTDYLPNLAIRLSFQFLAAVAHLVLLIWGITILWGI